MSTTKTSLVSGLLLAVAAFLPAEDIVAPSQGYLDQKAELEAMTAKRDLDLFEVTFEPMAFDRLVLADRTGSATSHGYLVFRIRNQISAGSAIPISQSKGYNEVLEAIVRQYEQTRVNKEHGVTLAVDGVQGKEGIIIERSDAQTSKRALDLTFQLTDEHGSRQHMLQDPSAPGAQDKFAFADQGTTVHATVSNAVRDRVEELLGRRLLTLDEIRGRVLPPYDAAAHGDDGWAAGEIWGVAVFPQLPPEGHRYRIDVRGLTNKFRIRWTPTEAGKPENYLDTVFYRRTFRLDYTVAGDEFHRQEGAMTLAKAGWEWQPTFQRSEQRRVQALVRYYLNNITGDNGDSINPAVQKSAWEWYEESRASDPARAAKLPDLKAGAP